MDESSSLPPTPPGSAPQAQPAADPAPSASAAPQPVVVRVEQPRQPRGLMIALIVLLSLALLTFGSCALIGGTAVRSFADLAGSSLGETGDGTGLDTLAMDSIAVYHMDDQIGSGYISSEEVRSVLRQAEDDPNVKALVVRVESPGGAASDGSEIASYIDDFSKPVVFSVGSYCASAAYLAASQSDWIVATDMSEVGAIGTIIESYNIEGLLDNLGVETQTVKSASMKDMGSMSRAMTDEERALLQDKVDRATEAFVEKVAQGRGVDVATVQGWANGTTYFGEEALDMGLVDEIGTYDDALAKAAELAGIDGDSYAIVSVDPETSLLDDFGLLGSLLG